ncbi:KH domain protein [Dirofilaria immitis]|nr:KH domain protein [Dirofilaria immitis]
MNTSTYSCEATPFSNDWFNAKHIGQKPEQLSVEQLLSLMNQINTSVKSGLFNAQLANQIFILCQQLKFSGQLLEQSHKNELNRVFVSLRQACCRDNGQLGTPCRLKMMELVELRAMGWRPSLAHTQYYLNRPEQQQQQQQQQQQIDPAPISAPPFGTIPVNPFGNFGGPPPPLYVGGDVNPVIAPQPAPTSFYLIPAAAASGWARPMIAPGVVPSSNILPQLTPFDIEAWAKASKQLQQTKLKVKTPQNRVPQLREEMIIRNSDSGKIMGVKGRRVAVVEELSKTVISFQKVDSKCKDRTLTITGNNQESIDYAKRLIEQTIRRNISPNRTETNGAEVDDNDNDDDDDDDDDDDNDVGISIETTQDGTLKLSCADPQVLQAAQAALSEYLTRVGRNHSRISAEEREQRKERRKSMPLQSSSNRQNMNYDASSVSTSNVQWRSSGKTGSTPNLTQLNSATAGSSVMTEVNVSKQRYDRIQLLKLRSAVGYLDSKTTATIYELEIERTQHANES